MRPKSAKIVAMGSYLPERVVANSDWERLVETSDEWITTRTGIKERRFCAEGETTTDMAERAATAALQNSHLTAQQIDMVLVHTATPDFHMPSTAAMVQGRIGASAAAALDLQAACSGFLYGLSIARALVESNSCQNVLFIASDKMSSYLNPQDRNTCILFGDGAAAVVVSREGSGFAIDEIVLGADGTEESLIAMPGGGARLPLTPAQVAEGHHYFTMKGRELFRHAVRRMGSAVKECMRRTSLTVPEISWMIPHQANVRIMEALAKEVAFPEERIAKTIHKYGNTSASSVGITFEELCKERPIAVGEHLLLTVVGAGLTWGSAVVTKVEENSL